MFERRRDDDHSINEYYDDEVSVDRNIRYRELYNDMYHYTKSDTTYREFCDYYNYTP